MKKSFAVIWELSNAASSSKKFELKVMSGCKLPVWEDCTAPKLLLKIKKIQTYFTHNFGSLCSFDLSPKQDFAENQPHLNSNLVFLLRLSQLIGFDYCFEYFGNFEQSNQNSRFGWSTAFVRFSWNWIGSIVANYFDIPASFYIFGLQIEFPRCKKVSAFWGKWDKPDKIRILSAGDIFGCLQPE